MAAIGSDAREREGGGGRDMAMNFILEYPPHFGHTSPCKCRPPKCPKLGQTFVTSEMIALF